MTIDDLHVDRVVDWDAVAVYGDYLEDAGRDEEAAAYRWLYRHRHWPTYMEADVDAPHDWWLTNDWDTYRSSRYHPRAKPLRRDYSHWHYQLLLGMLPAPIDAPPKGCWHFGHKTLESALAWFVAAYHVNRAAWNALPPPADLTLFDHPLPARRATR